MLGNNLKEALVCVEIEGDTELIKARLPSEGIYLARTCVRYLRGSLPEERLKGERGKIGQGYLGDGKLIYRSNRTV